MFVSPAARGTIRGRVDLGRVPVAAERRPNVADLGMPEARGAPERRPSVVYLEIAPRPAFEEREEAHARMDQRRESFVPHVLAIAAGTTVDFPNNDHTYHNVFSLSKARPFDLGRYGAGRSKAVRFDRPGIVRVFCEIHSHMSAFVLVFGHRFFSVTDPEGRYAIDNVPPGTYTVKVWNEALAAEPRQVSLLEDGGDVELNFSLGQK
ncbi:MAG: hypothetical protein HYX76_02645 [Acidobacteria bacterium]|nr:hypothetical protein [Acidobacteriota bacterium]